MLSYIWRKIKKFSLARVSSGSKMDAMQRRKRDRIMCCNVNHGELWPCEENKRTESITPWCFSPCDLVQKNPSDTQRVYCRRYARFIAKNYGALSRGQNGQWPKRPLQRRIHMRAENWQLPERSVMLAYIVIQSLCYF